MNGPVTVQKPTGTGSQAEGRTSFTHSSFEDAVVDVVRAALRAAESEPLTVLVALLISQLDRSSQRAVSLLLPLVLMLSPELGGVES